MAEAFEVEVADEKVLIRYRGKIVRTLVGKPADQFRAAVARGEDVQELVARMTGYFPRGDE